MKILVIDKSVVRGKIDDASCPLLKHIKYWYQGNNKIDLIARVEEGVAKKIKRKVNLIKLPPRIIFFALYYTYFHLIFRSKKYDLIIEAWGNRPTFRLIYNTKRSLIAVFGSRFKIILPGKLFRLIYGKSRFLVNSHIVQDKLIKLGIKKGNIEYIPDGVKGKKGSKKSVRKKKKILIICGKDINGAVSLISLIERRSLDWKFIVLADKKYAARLKSVYENSGLKSKMKAMVKNDYSFNKNLIDSKYVVITKGVKKASDYISSAFFEKTPVLMEGVEIIRNMKIHGLVLDYNNKMDMASEIITLSKNNNDYKNLQYKIEKSMQFHTWDEVGRLSLKFIESL